MSVGAFGGERHSYFGKILLNLGGDWFLLFFVCFPVKFYDFLESWMFRKTLNVFNAL